MKANRVVHRSFVCVTACVFVSTFSALHSDAQQSLQTLHKHVPSVVSSGQAALVGPVPATQKVQMAIILPVRNQAALTSLLSELYDPSSPNYHHFLTVQQFTDQFGPTTQDYENVIKWAMVKGLTVVNQSKNRLILDVSGTARQVNTALSVSMNVYRDPNGKRTFYSIDREPTLDLSVPIAHIEGLSNFSVPLPMVKRKKNAGPVADVTGSGPGGYYLGSDMRAAYYGGTLLAGAGQCVGLFEFGGYRLSDVNLTFNNAGQSYSVPINNVLIDGASAAAGSDDSEEVLDIAQAIGMAPGLSQVRVYIGIENYDPDIFNEMATENVCKQLSVSWSWVPDDPVEDDSIFQELAAQGQSVFVASGDYGAYDAAVSPYFYPAEDAYVTAVGATHLTTNYGGGSWVGETAWNSPPYGSGGGVSPDEISIPSWQQGAVTYASGGSYYLRNVPDVAMEGDLDNYYCDMGTCQGGAGGTSFAAARWAGLMALINQQATEAGTAPSGGLGFLNPTVYSIGGGSNYDADLHDITSGNNDSDNQPTWYNAVTGYDLVTGWGSPNGQNLINALAGSLVPGFWISPSPASLSAAQGSSTTGTISVIDAGGFAGNVSLTASGLPSGVTASFNPSTTAGTSVLTLTASSSATVGTATVVITGTSGSVTSKTSVFVGVNSQSTPPPPSGTLGSVNVGTTSNPSMLTVTFATAGTLNSISTLTQGVPNLDFANASGGTCAIGTAYAANATCTVDVTFTPKYAGTRYGAIVLFNASGTRLAQVFLQGTGNAPQTTFNPGTQTTIGSGFAVPEGAAMLGNGSMYVTDYGASGTPSGLYLESLSNGTYTQTKTNCTFDTPVGVAVDGSGTIYVTDPGVPAVYKVVILNGNCNLTAIGSGFVTPWGVAVDGSGDVYIADLGSSSVAGAVYKETLQSNGAYVQSTIGSGWVTPVGVAVNANGDIDVADSSIPGVFTETPSGGSYTQTPVGQGWTAPSGIAVDGIGDIYVSDAGNSLYQGHLVPAGVYKEVFSGGSYVQTSIGVGWVLPYGIAVDASGNVYVADSMRGVYKEDLADPPQLGFANAVAGTVSIDSPKTVVVSNSGTAPLTFSSLAYPPDFPEANGVATDCTSTTVVGPAANCTLSIDFSPTAALGSNTSLLLNETVAISTNNLNSPATQQTLAVSGTEVLPGGSVVLNASSDPAVAGASVTFTATVTGAVGGPTPTGTVTFLNGTTPLGAPIAPTNGVASYSTSSLPIGTYQVVASYSGDSNYLAANSNTITETIVSSPATSSFGNTSIGNQNVGSTSSVIPLTITFTSAATLGNIAVLTEGSPNLDFTNAGAGTCSVGTAYSANATCTVNVSFTPKYPGTRYGAVVLSDNNGNVIGTGYLEGTGVGPQTVFLPGTLTSLASGFSYPQGVAVDGNRNLYVADATGGAVYKETLSSGTYSQSTVASGFSEPYGVAVDAAGNIYVADVGSHAVYKETPSNGGYIQTAIGYGFIWPSDVAVDALGNVYVADFGNGVNPGAVYIETLSNGSYTQSTIGSGFVTPQGVAVDGGGNIYVADSANGNGTGVVYKMAPSNGGYNQTAIGTGWVTPTGVAVDDNGNVYVTDDAYDLGDGFVAKEALQSDGSYVQSTVLGSASTPYPAGVVVDGLGNLYVTDNFDGVLYRDDLADPPTLSFVATIFGATSSDSPKTISVENVGNTNLIFSAVSYPTDFPEGPGITTDCKSSTSLGAGATCSLSTDFTPASPSGTNQSTVLSEIVAITTNSLNAGSTPQAIAVSGTEATPIATLSLTVPAGISTVGAAVTFTATVTGESGFAAPTGTVTFYSSGTALTTTPLNNGTAVYSTSSLAVGSYTITAAYSGDQNYPSATSNAVNEQIIPASTFGTQTIGDSSSKSITITFSSKVTLGSISVVTQGVPNLDFTNAGGGSCAVGTKYTSGSTCTVNIAFKPMYSGTRYGAIVLADNTTLIQAVPLQGTGIGPQLSFLPVTEKTVYTNQYDIGGVYVDENGAVYVDSESSSGAISVTKLTPSGSGYTSTTIPTSSLTFPAGGVAVDSSGSIYVSNSYESKSQTVCSLLKETLVGGTYTQSTIFNGQACWSAFAVDQSGNIYLSYSDTTQKIVKETLSGGVYTQTTISSGTLPGPSTMVVDGNGNLFVWELEGGAYDGDPFEIQILKFTPSGGSYVESTIVSSTQVGYGAPFLDGNGDVFFGILGSQTLDEAIPSGTGYTIVSSQIPISNLEDAFAIDSGHNLYVSTGAAVTKIDSSDPPSITFAATNVGATSSDSPRTVSIENVGNAALTVSVPGAGTNPSVSSNFSLNSITTCPQVSTSGPAGTLNVNSSCNYGINFTPTTTGAINGSVVLTDNAAGETQAIPLNGTGNAGGSGGAVMAMLKMGPGGVPVGVVVPNQSTAGSENYEKVWVDTVHQTYILGAVYLQENSQGQATCALYNNSQTHVTAGQWPLFGALKFDTENYKIQGCSGLFPFAVARYTWGSNQTSDQAIEQDPFVLLFTNGIYGNAYGFSAELAHITVSPAMQSGSGSNPPLTATATLMNPPPGTDGYGWTITGGNGAIVFPNGQENMPSTTPSINIEEPNPSGTSVPFIVQVNISYPSAGTANVATLGPVALTYGPAEDAFSFATLSCSPSSVTRGSSVTCAASAPSGASFSNWEFSDGTNTVNGSGTSATWSGVMVASGTVSVTVTSNGQATTASAQVTVSPRNWHTSPASPTEVPNGSLVVQGVTITLPVPPQPIGTDSGLGESGFQISYNGFSGTTISDKGPNNGYYYYPSQLTFSTFFFQYEINPDLENTTSTFYQAQCGNYNASTNPDGFISGSALLTQTNRHEWNSSTQSHYAFYSTSLNKNNPGDLFESRVATPGANLPNFDLATVNAIKSDLDAITSAALVEPFPVNNSATGAYLGTVNYEVNGVYASCN